VTNNGFKKKMPKNVEFQKMADILKKQLGLTVHCFSWTKPKEMVFVSGHNYSDRDKARGAA